MNVSKGTLGKLNPKGLKEKLLALELGAFRFC